MAEDRKPRRRTDNPMDIAIKLRMDKATDEKIRYLMSKLNKTRSFILRQCVHDLYEQLKEG